MKGPITASAILHIIVLILGLVSLSSAKKLDAGSSESFPVDIVPIEELTQIQEGVKTAPKAEKSAPVPTKKPQTVANAQNTGDNETDLPTPPKPADKPKPVETAEAPAPQPKPVKKPEEVKPEEAKTDPVAEAIAKEAEAAKAAEAKAAEAKAAEAKAAEAKAAEKAKAVATEEKAAKLEAEALLKAEADTKAADAQKQAADKAAKEKAAEEAAKKAEADAEVKAAAKAEAKAQAEAEAKAAADAEAKAAAVEAKAKKTADAKAKKASEAKKAAAEQAAADKKLNEDIEKALLNKDTGATGGAKRSTDTASLGGKKKTGGSKLSVSEMDALRGMIEKCWNPPTGINDAGSLKITIKMSLNEAGEVEGSPKVVAGGGASGIERAAAEAARRAVLKCAPYNLPAEKFDAWSEVIVNFDPSEMF
jgi:colicin import membrane protein